MDLTQRNYLSNVNVAQQRSNETLNPNPPGFVRENDKNELRLSQLIIISGVSQLSFNTLSTIERYEKIERFIYYPRASFTTVGKKRYLIAS